MEKILRKRYIFVPSFPSLSTKVSLWHAHCRPRVRPRSAPRRDLRSSLDGGNTASHPPADSYRLSCTARFLVRAALVLRSTSRRQRLDVCFCWAREVSTRRQWRQWISCTTPVCGTELAPTCLTQCAPDECTDLPAAVRAVGQPRPPNIQRPRSRIGCHRCTPNLSGPEPTM